MNLVKNLLYIHASQRTQFEIASLVKGLEQTSQMTYVTDSPENAAVREALQAPCSVNYDKVPLAQVAADFSQQMHVPVKLDLPELEKEGLTGQEEVSLTMVGKSRATTLRFLLKDGADIPLRIVPQNGILLITSSDRRYEPDSIAIFNVSDLLTGSNAIDLLSMIETETDGRWFNVDGEGGTLRLVADGRLVVRQTVAVIDEIKHLLSRSRELIVIDQPASQADLKRIETRFYRVPSQAASDLSRVIRTHIAPETWKSGTSLQAIGTIDQVAIGFTQFSTGDGMTGMGGGFFAVNPQPTTAPEKKPSPSGAAPPQVTLIITQRVGVHEQISKFLNELQYGHPNSRYGRFQMTSPREACF